MARNYNTRHVFERPLDAVFSMLRKSVVAALCLTASSAIAMDFRVEYSDNRPIFPPTLWVDITGDVEQGDTSRFLEAIRPYSGQVIHEIRIRLDSPGGNLPESLRLGRTISELPYTTLASIGTEGGSHICASACVNIYLGADYRFLSGDSRIGVHRFSASGTGIGADEAMSISQELSAKIVEHIRSMRADPSFFEIMVSAHAEDIYWVPRAKLEELRVVTGGIYDEFAEYRNINGSIELRIRQVGRVGTNEMSLVCGDRGLVAIFDLNEPEFPTYERFELFIDGSTVALNDYEVIESGNSRLKAMSLLPWPVLERLTNSRELGARAAAPNAGVFFGFEGGVEDAKIAETAKGCWSSLLAAGLHMKLVEGTDFTGGDLTQGGYRPVTFEECWKICMSDVRCVAVSYLISHRWCWPKGRVLVQVPNANVLSAFLD